MKTKLYIFFFLFKTSNLYCYDLDYSSFEFKQDSIRSLILEIKQNKILKNSFLQELYIKNLVTEKDNQFNFELPFDLHSLDCLAPDCYVTNISFSISNTTPVIFPTKINISIIEEGCGKENKIQKSESFILIESSNDYINYYSDKLHSNLIITENPYQLYYFPKSKSHPLKIKQINKLFKDYDDENDEYNIPYRSSRFETNEYDRFTK